MLGERSGKIRSVPIWLEILRTVKVSPLLLGLRRCNTTALELLNALLVALADFDVNVHGVAGSKGGEAGAALLRFGVNKVE